MPAGNATDVTGPRQAQTTARCASLKLLTLVEKNGLTSIT